MGVAVDGHSWNGLCLCKDSVETHGQSALSMIT